MNEHPLVSIGTCSYNNGKYIIETLESIKSQSYDNIQLIIVDDCSTDNSVELINDWLRSYAGKYIFICHDVNIGGAAPYNECIKNASGKYFCIIDSDDALMPDKVKTQVAILEQSNIHVAAVYSDTYVMDIDSNMLDGLFIQRHRQFTQNPSGNIYNELLQGNYIPILSVMVRKSVLDIMGVFDESLIYGDYDLWLRITREYDFIFSDYVSAKYRIRPGSLSFAIKNWIYSDAKIFLKHTDAAVPIPRLQNLALKAYLTEDDATLGLVNELSEKINDSVLTATAQLWKYKIPLAYGSKILEKLNESNNSIWYKG